MDLLINVAGLTGVALLAIPALYAEKYARLLSRLRSLGPIAGNPALVEAHQRALTSLEEHQKRWTRGLSFCLIAGTLFAALSYLLGILKVAGTVAAL